MTSLVSGRGFTADIHSHAATFRSKPSRRRALVLLVLGASFVFVLSVLPSLGKTDTVNGDSSADMSQGMYYDFRVHALNCTLQTRASNGTSFMFTTADLPFEFSSVLFGDHRSDTSFTRRYYGGSGILLNASGANAIMTLREIGGGVVSRIDYQGQAQVVFNGMIESVTYPNNTTVYEGTDQMVQHWRDGNWTPDDGVFVEHPSSVSLTSAKFYLMVLEPAGTTDIPEFELVPVIGVVSGAFLVIRWRASSRKTR